MKWTVLARWSDEPAGGGRGWHPESSFDTEQDAVQEMRRREQEERASGDAMKQNFAVEQTGESGQ